MQNIANYALLVIYLLNAFPWRITKFQYSTQTKYEIRKQEAGGDKYYVMLQRFLLLWQILIGFDPIEKKTLTNRGEFSLIRADKIIILSFKTFDMDLIIMFDRKEMLWYLVILSFMPSFQNGVADLMSHNAFRWSVRDIKMSVNCKFYSNFKGLCNIC